MADTDWLWKQVVVDSNADPAPILPAVSGKVLELHRLFVTFDAATNAAFKDGTTALSGALDIAAGGTALTLSGGDQPFYVTSAGNALNLSNSGAAHVRGTAWYTQR